MFKCPRMYRPFYSDTCVKLDTRDPGWDGWWGSKGKMWCSVKAKAVHLNQWKLGFVCDDSVVKSV